MTTWRASWTDSLLKDIDIVRVARLLATVGVRSRIAFYHHVVLQGFEGGFDGPD